MVCRTYKLPDGTMAMVCSRGQKRHFCAACRKPATLQCDAPTAARPSGVCDRYICVKCAIDLGDDRHICPLHKNVKMPPKQGEMAL